MNELLLAGLVIAAVLVTIALVSIRNSGPTVSDETQFWLDVMDNIIEKEDRK